MFKEILKLLLFFFLRLIPKDKNLLVFGDRDGKRGFSMPAFELQPAKYFGVFDDLGVFLFFKGVSDDAELLNRIDFSLPKSFEII